MAMAAVATTNNPLFRQTQTGQITRTEFEKIASIRLYHLHRTQGAAVLEQGVV